MKNKIIMPLICFIFTYAVNSFSYDLSPKISFNDLLNASAQISFSKPHKRVDKLIAGQEIYIHGKKYEVRFFSFEDPKNILASNTNFGQYVRNNKLEGLTATHMKYMPGIEFEVFDYRFTKLEDGIYFSMALRQI